MKLKTYKMTALVRPDDLPGPEWVYTGKFNARSETEARREFLEATWSGRLLVSHFLRVSVIKTKKGT